MDTNQQHPKPRKRSKRSYKRIWREIINQLKQTFAHRKLEIKAPFTFAGFNEERKFHGNAILHKRADAIALSYDRAKQRQDYITFYNNNQLVASLVKKGCASDAAAPYILETKDNPSTLNLGNPLRVIIDFTQAKPFSRQRMF